MILALDTSTLIGSLALAQEEEILCEINFQVPGSFSGSLMVLIDQVLRSYQVSLKEMKAFAVGLGPGSFTALRIGLATIKGLAYSVGKPILGIPTLDALAANLPLTPFLICPIIDAKKGEVYFSLYRWHNQKLGLERLAPYQVLPPDRLAEAIEKEVIFLGDGLVRYQARLSELLGVRVHFAPRALWLVRAGQLVPLALARLAKGEHDDLSALTPLYVRRSQAEETAPWGESS